MEPMETKSIKMPAYLWAFLEKMGGELGYKLDKRGLHSRIVREMVSAAAIRWQESPYIARASSNVVLVTRTGHLFYRQIQVLKLNKRRSKLPFLLDLFASRRSELSPFRPHWLLNHFAVWHGGDPSCTETEPLAASVDRHRADAKLADLKVDEGGEHILTREIIAGLADYVQWKGSDGEDDRFDFPVDIPTRNLEILVVVDLDLYRKTARTDHTKMDVPNLKLEFRNRELARFEGEAIGNDEFNRLSPPLQGRFLASKPGSAGDVGKKPRKGAGDKEPPTAPDGRKFRPASVDPRVEMLQTCSGLKARVEHLATAQVDDGAVVPPEEREGLREALTLPESFLYYKRKWPSPYFGVEVGIQWEKPEKPD